MQGNTKITGGQIGLNTTNLKVVVEEDLQSYIDANDAALLKARGTEVLGGTGEVSLISPTTFSVAPVVGQIKDSTGYYSINYPGGNNITVINTGVTNIWVYIDKAGTLQQQITEPTRSEFREKLFITRLALVGGVLTAQGQETNPAGQYTNMLRDYLSYIVNPKKGLELSPNANLTFQVSAGSIFELGAKNANDEDNPNELSFTLQNPTTFFYVDRDTVLASGQTSINVTSYDLNGTQTALTNNRFKILTVYKFNSGNHIIQDGQEQFSTIDEANAAISNRNYVINPILSTGTRLGWIIVQQGASNLQVVTTARLINDKGDIATATSTAGSLLASNNLSDLENVITARTNLDVYSKNEVVDLTTNQTIGGAKSFNGEIDVNTASGIRGRLKNIPILSLFVTVSRSITSNDAGLVLSVNVVSDINLTIDTGSLTEIGDITYIDQINTAKAVFLEGAGVTIQAKSGRLLETEGQFTRTTIQKVGSTTYRIISN